jgi:hypothetical protein
MTTLVSKWWEYKRAVQCSRIWEARANTEAASKLRLLFVRCTGTRMQNTEHGDIMVYLGREYLV